MESHTKEKRSRSLSLIALSSLVTLSTTLTGCSQSTGIAEKPLTAGKGLSKRKTKDEKEKEEPTSTSHGFFHFWGGNGARGYRTPSASTASKPAFGTVSRGWFGGFRFSGG